MKESSQISGGQTMAAAIATMAMMLAGCNIGKHGDQLNLSETTKSCKPMVEMPEKQELKETFYLRNRNKPLGGIKGGFTEAELQWHLYYVADLYEEMGYPRDSEWSMDRVKHKCLDRTEWHIKPAKDLKERVGSTWCPLNDEDVRKCNIAFRPSVQHDQRLMVVIHEAIHAVSFCMRGNISGGEAPENQHSKHKEENIWDFSEPTTLLAEAYFRRTGKVWNDEKNQFVCQ